jgi:hypothetical protein
MKIKVAVVLVGFTYELDCEQKNEFIKNEFIIKK